MIGQINRQSIFGEELYKLSKKIDIKTIVEIGTWNGAGSTKCIIDGIIDSNHDKTFISLESSQTKYFEAQNNLKGYEKYVKLLWGRIIDVHDLTWLKAVTLGPEQQQWLWEDIENYKYCPLILNEIPEKIDLLLLDGGEFSTIPEFKKLYKRYTYLALDDINSLKTKEIYKQLLKKTDHTLIKEDSERNGFAIFKKENT
jgi:hypothetical protein